MLNEKKIDEMFSKIVNRLDKLEKAVFSEETQVGKKTKKQKKYSGLTGGIQMLIDNNFFDIPKGVPTIASELKREAYHYPTESIRTALSRDFTKKNRVLTRIVEKNKYKYVVRK